MALKKITTLEAVCDECGPDWWQLHEDLSATPAFTCVRSAREILTWHYGWKITGRGKTLRMLCRHCAAIARCAEVGHDWHLLPAREWVQWNGYTIEPPLECSRCETRDTGLPDGHPESLDTELSDAHEELLAALDAELFPEDAT
jgi:hypothetical protein